MPPFNFIIDTQTNIMFYDLIKDNVIKCCFWPEPRAFVPHMLYISSEGHSNQDSLIRLYL